MVLLASIPSFANRTFLELIKTIYGVNLSRATRIASVCGVSPFARIKHVPDRFYKRAESFILDNFKVGRDARHQVQLSIKKLKNINSYRALRMSQGLPSHGQRTRSNAKTSKKFGRDKNIYFRTDVHRFRSDDPRKGYIKKGSKNNKPVITYSNAKHNNPLGTMKTYKAFSSYKKLPFLVKRKNAHKRSKKRRMLRKR